MHGIIENRRNTIGRAVADPAGYLAELAEDALWRDDWNDDWDDYGYDAMRRWDAEDEDRLDHEAAVEGLTSLLLFPVRIAEAYLDHDFTDRYARRVLS